MESFSFHLPLTCHQPFIQQGTPTRSAYHFPALVLDCVNTSLLSTGTPRLSLGGRSQNHCTRGLLHQEEDGMDIGGSVVFSVNPPSPLESDLCADDQESILRTWHTASNSATSSSTNGGSEPTSEQASSTSNGHTTQEETYYTYFEPEVMDHGAKLSSIFLSDSASTGEHGGSTAFTQGTRSAGSSSLSKKVTMGIRRSASNENPHRKSELYKTELCVSVNSGIPCKYGDNCQFAHNAHELQHVNRHPRYKTQFCTSFTTQGYCKYNDRCTFIHHPEEARVPLSSIMRKRSAGASGSGKLEQLSSSWITTTSPASGSASGSGTITPIGATAAALQSKNGGERVRALSDPGHIYTEVHRQHTTARATDVALSSLEAAGAYAHLSQGLSSVAAAASTGARIGNSDGLPAMDERLRYMAGVLQTLSSSSMRPLQHSMAINGHHYSSDAIMSTDLVGMPLGYHHYHQDVSSYSATEMDYSTSSGMASSGDITASDHGLGRSDYGLGASNFSVGTADHSLGAPQYGVSSSDYGVAPSEYTGSFGSTSTYASNAIATATTMKISAPPSSWDNPLLRDSSANPWREAAAADDDEEWASKLAYYIATPHNDFGI